ncbi:MAG: DUF1573 domain-containing protein [candidate division Zixibacteria bacterium]|nr:DUF1573 domain-containing protein [candidate division Zixibacteria bacterium]
MQHWFRQITMVLLCGFIAISSQAQSGLEISPTAFDFGWAPQNATLVCQVWAYTSGKDTITISEIKTGCGCLMVRPESTQIAPGDSLILPSYWQTRGFVGHRTVSAYLYSESNQRPKELTVGGNVVTQDDSTASVHWWPQRLEFHPANLSHKNDVKQVITLTNRTETDLSMIMIEYGPELKLDIPESIQAKQTALVQVAIADYFLEDDFESSFTLEFTGNSNESFRVSIPVVAGDFSFRPNFTTTKQ